LLLKLITERLTTQLWSRASRQFTN